MVIYLVQHGKARDKQQDPERGLSEEGRRQTLVVGRNLFDAGVAPMEIWHSGKTRARQTAEILGRQLRFRSLVKPVAGMSSNDDPRRFAAQRLAGKDQLMLVGHLPFMDSLAALLVTGSMENRVCAFRNSAVVSLESDAEHKHWWITSMTVASL